ncbi:gp220 [Bacillus phage G]|uniref:Gp220 n=1 Tax=Bacillus phage G TaxID=2884420 RepID=G3M9W1_9CAUD|nr:gp220 [Bacillus phage G]AEO93479.1 gp220 [Bacillus phage G]
MTTLEKILSKEAFNIQDLAEVTKRKTQTIRSWEKKGIIKDADMRNSNNWRQYSKERFVEILNQILSHPWERQVIKNVAEVEYVINELTNKQEKAASDE